jgi:hypothetical protein
VASLDDQLRESGRREDEARQAASRIEQALQEAVRQVADGEARQGKLARSREAVGQQLAKLEGSLLCELCRRPLRSPVTSIPCGHSYCLECKRGYEKQCAKCPGSTREAVYRNELLDDIIEATRLVAGIIGQLSA